MGPFLVSEGHQHVPVSRVPVRDVFFSHALSRHSTDCIVMGPKFLISSVRISSSPAAFPFFRCFNEYYSSMIVKSSSKVVVFLVASFDLALSLSVWYLVI